MMNWTKTPRATARPIIATTIWVVMMNTWYQYFSAVCIRIAL